MTYCKNYTYQYIYRIQIYLFISNNNKKQNKKITKIN